MDRSDPRARQHRDHGFGDHGHVDDDPVARADALASQDAGEAGDLTAQLSIRECLDPARDGAVVDERSLVGAAVLDMPIDRVVAGVDDAAREPAVERGARVIEHAIPSLVPVYGFAGFGPEPFRVLGPLRIHLVLDAVRGVDARHDVHESPKGAGCLTCGAKAASRASTGQHACRGHADLVAEDGGLSLMDPGLPLEIQRAQRAGYGAEGTTSLTFTPSAAAVSACGV